MMHAALLTLLVLLGSAQAFAPTIDPTPEPNIGCQAQTLAAVTKMVAEAPPSDLGAIQCLTEFFTGLGPKQTQLSLAKLATTQKNYTGYMHWFNGTKEMLDQYQYMWIGIDFDGKGTGTITLRIEAPADIGYVEYHEACPELDSTSPCATIDFPGDFLPRKYYTRVTPSGEFISFVKVAAGYYSDVNVLTPAPIE
mmetsp:Transcript_58678/g.96884  ORF Transcript_58678/g.96884 Transcript_58678/m.96884 type:complete len:195 (+) Transcript_58678:125-709(+)